MALVTKRCLFRELFLIVFILVPSFFSAPVDNNSDNWSLESRFRSVVKFWEESKCIFPSRELFQEVDVFHPAGFPLKACSVDAESSASARIQKWMLCDAFFNTSRLLCVDLPPKERESLDSTSLKNLVATKEPFRLCEDAKKQNIKTLKPMFVASDTICDECARDKNLQPVCSYLFAAVLNYLEAARATRNGSASTGSSGRTPSGPNSNSQASYNVPGTPEKAVGGQGSETSAAGPSVAGQSGGVPSVGGDSPMGESGGTPPFGEGRPADGGDRPVMGGSSPVVMGNRPIVGGGSSAAGGGSPAATGDSSVLREGSSTVGGGSPAVGGGGSAVGGGSPRADHPVVGGDHPALGGDHPEVAEDHPAVGGSNPVLGGGSTAAGRGSPAVGGGQPAVGEVPPTERGDAPVLGAGGPAVGGGGPALRGDHPLVGEVSPTEGGHSPVLEGGSPGMGGGSPAMGGGGPAMGGGSPVMGGGGPATGESSPAMGGGSPVVGGGSLAAGGNRPAVTGGIPAGEGDSPVVGEGIPAGGPPKTDQPWQGDHTSLNTAPQDLAHPPKVNEPSTGYRPTAGPLPVDMGQPAGGSALKIETDHRPAGEEVVPPNNDSSFPVAAGGAGQAGGGPVNQHVSNALGTQDSSRGKAPGADTPGLEVGEGMNNENVPGSDQNPVWLQGGKNVGGFDQTGGNQAPGQPHQTRPGLMESSSSWQTPPNPDEVLDDNEEDEEEGDWEIDDQGLLGNRPAQNMGAAAEVKPPVQKAPAIPPDGVQTLHNVVRHPFEDEEAPSGHFMAYFITAVVLCVAGYVVYHNKQKIFAIALEGRRDSLRRRPASGGESGSTAKYSKLQTTVEEVVPALEKSTSSKNYIY